MKCAGLGYQLFKESSDNEVTQREGAFVRMAVKRQLLHAYTVQLQ